MGAKYFQEFDPSFFEMSSVSGYLGAKYFQEFGPRLFDMSSVSGYMGAKYFQEFGPRFLACHDPSVACHGMSISIVSISSVSCRVRILHVSVSVPCRGYLDGPRTQEQGPRSKKQGPKTRVQLEEPRTKDQLPSTQVPRPRTNDQEQGGLKNEARALFESSAVDSRLFYLCGN